MSKGAEAGANREAVSELRQQAIDVGRALVGSGPRMKEEGISIEVADNGVELYRGNVVVVTYSVSCHGTAREDLADMAAQQMESDGYLAINVGRGQVKLILSEEAIRQAVEGTAMIRQAVDVVRSWQERRRGGAHVEKEPGLDGVVQGAQDGTREEVLDEGGIRS